MLLASPTRMGFQGGEAGALAGAHEGGLEGPVIQASWPGRWRVVGVFGAAAAAGDTTP